VLQSCSFDKGNEIMTIVNAKELTIDTTPVAANIGEVIISADKRATTGKTLTDSERIRRVVIPAGHWGNLEGTIDSLKLQALTDVLTTGLKSIASARLRDTLSENPMARTVALADYTVPSLLSWSEETASSRGSLTFTREQVEEWFPTSNLATDMKARSQAHYDLILKRLAALSAKNHGITKPEDALKLQTLLANDAAAATTDEQAIVGELIQRLAHIEKTLSARVETAISMDDI
jgi:hypothetical protein